MNVMLMYFFLLLATDEGTGSVYGTVMNAENDAPLIGATVMVVGTSYGSMTDSFGRYEILHLAAGTYSLQARMVGMGEMTVEGVEIETDRRVEQNFLLTPYYIGGYRNLILIRI